MNTKIVIASPLRTAPAEQWLQEVGPLLATLIAEERRLVQQRRELSTRQTRAQRRCLRRRVRRQAGKPSQLAAELNRVEEELAPLAGRILAVQELVAYFKQHRRSQVTLHESVVAEGRIQAVPAFPAPTQNILP